MIPKYYVPYKKFLGHFSKDDIQFSSFSKNIKYTRFDMFILFFLLIFSSIILSSLVLIIYLFSMLFKLSTTGANNNLRIFIVSIVDFL